jgi:putative heme-binding domain-containing protein
VKRFIPDVDSPRGLVWDHDRLYLMHPPHLSAFIDKDGDGVADEQKILVKNIAFTFKDRPADHTSNGVTLGIDGWLYLAIGDFGFLKAEGTDGRSLQLRGGGVVRVRPDGAGLELYSRGTRNILEVAMDPLLNGFARDNTNDGGGWDIRLHHFTGLEDHGYPTLFKNFGDEVVQPLADYGGGSGCGSLYLSEPGFPDGYGDALYTADWGRDRVYRHKLTPNGATFKADQTEFLTVPRVTDLDVDANGHLYVSSWKGATFTFNGEDVGFILRVTPKGHKAAPLPDYAKLDRPMLVTELVSPSHRRRLAAQRELIARGIDDETKAALRAIIGRAPRKPSGPPVPTRDGIPVVTDLIPGLVQAMPDLSPPLSAKVAALFALKLGIDRQAEGLRNIQADPKVDAPPAALLLWGVEGYPGVPTDPSIREYVLRAWAGRPDSVDDSFLREWSADIRSTNPRVRLQALQSFARFGMHHAASVLLDDPDPIVAHTAVRVMAAGKASIDAFKDVLDPSRENKKWPAAIRGIQSMHEIYSADYLIDALGRIEDRGRRIDIIGALARLAHREGFWRGDSWGTRPDTSGPYYQPEAWEATPKIEAALKEALDKSSGDDFAAILRELDRNKVKVDEAAIVARANREAALVPAVVAHLARGREVPAPAVPFLVRSAKEGTTAQRSEATVALLKVDGDEGLRTALESLGALHDECRDTPPFREARDAFLDARRLVPRRRALEALAARREGRASAWADAALLVLASTREGRGESRAAAAKAIDTGWNDPARRAQLLLAIALIGHQASADRVLKAIDDPNPSVASAAREAARELGLDPSKDAALAVGPKVESMKLDDVFAAVVETKGDRGAGERLFNRLTCVNCHTVRADETPKGPFLGTIATTYKRRELAEAILHPSKTIAQGFTTNIFELEDGRTLTGFVTKEAADSVVVRDAEAKETQIPASQIVERTKSATSVMPEGLVKGITVKEFASLLDYLESLSKK